MKKNKWVNIAIWVGLALLVVAVIITAIILHTKNRELEDLKDKNDKVSSIKIVEENEEQENNKIFFKKFAFFIDKDIFF